MKRRRTRPTPWCSPSPQPRGEEGIWCVDRWVDQNGTRYLVVPETDQPMDDYYAALQDACDAGDRPDLLDPVAVALDFEEDWSGRDLSPRRLCAGGCKRSLGALRPASGHGGVGERSRRLRGQGSSCPQKIQAHAQNEGVRLFPF